MRLAADLPAAAIEPPVAHSWWWPVLAGALLLALLLWYAVLLRRWRSGRASPDAASPSVTPTPTTDVERLRAEALGRIDALAADVEAGGVPARTAYDALSHEVRGFVGAATGRAADAMTLDDLRGSGLPRVPDVVALLYPGQFGPDPEPDPRPAIATAREVVATWR